MPPLAPTVERFLAGHAVAYDLIAHARTESLEQAAQAAQIPALSMARAVVLHLNGKVWMAVLPLSHIIDFAALAQLLQGRPTPVTADTLADLLPDCEPGSVPPLGAAYGLNVLCDEAVLSSRQVVFEAGRHETLVRVDQAAMRQLLTGARMARFARPLDALVQPAAAERSNAGGSPAAAAGMSDLRPDREIAKRIEAIYELPVMPEHARRLLELRNQPDASAGDLAEVVELDPSLAAQVMRYARSPLFGYRGKVDALQDAISRVLGFDLVVNLALGLAALKPFRNPPDGPLGLHAFWRQATYGASLSQQLLRLIPAGHRPKPGLSYLAALLHNFGYLVIGHLFQPEFFLLNKMVAANPSLPIARLERQVLCMGQARELLCWGHAEVGAWLLRSWQLPDEVVAVAREHHRPDYDGPHHEYVHLIRLSNYLLGRQGIGDAAADAPPQDAFDAFGLEEWQVVPAAEAFLEGCEGTEDVIGQWVA